MAVFYIRRGGRERIGADPAEYIDELQEDEGWEHGGDGIGA